MTPTDGPDDGRLTLLSDAHDLLDAVNARSTSSQPSCTWCYASGYDGLGLIHTERCIIVRLRRAISQEQPG